MEPSRYKFNSITNLYKGLPTDIDLEIFEYGSDAVEVKLINTNFAKQYNSLKLQFICFNLCCVFYILVILYHIFIHLLYIDIVLSLLFILLLWRLNNLVEFEKFILCYDFGIHLQIQKRFGKQNRFIPACAIHDIVLNEIIENLDFRYILILRTKGTLFKTNPIISVFKAFKPTIECLSLIYNHVNKVMIKNYKES